MGERMDAWSSINYTLSAETPGVKPVTPAILHTYQYSQDRPSELLLVYLW